jgi:hypothetical protein
MAKKERSAHRHVMHARQSVPATLENIQRMMERSAIISHLPSRLAKLEEQFCRIITKYQADRDSPLIGTPEALASNAARAGKTVAEFVAEFTADPETFPPGKSPPLIRDAPPIAHKARDGYQAVHQIREALESGDIVAAVQAAITAGGAGMAIEDIIRYELPVSLGITSRANLTKGTALRRERVSTARERARQELQRRMTAKPTWSKTAHLKKMARDGGFGSLRSLHTYCTDIAPLHK